MDYETALAILGLKPNFTEDELKEAYRRLSKENHPDKYGGNEEKTAKQARVNAAKDYLKGYAIKDNTTRDSFNIDAYITKKLNDLKKIVKYNGPIIQDEDFVAASTAIGKIINTFKTDVFISYLLNKEDIDQLYMTCILFIKTEFEKFKTSYYKRHQIDENKVRETLNFDCTLIEFYSQLVEIKDKYSIEAQTNKLLEQEIEKYKTYAGYERLSLLVTVCKNNALYDIKASNYQYIEQEIEKMHQRIMTEVFEVYYYLKKKLSDLEIIINNINDEKIKYEYKSIKEHFENGSSFNIIENAIKKLEDMIEKYSRLEQKKVKFKENERAINETYKSLIDRYSEVLKTYNIVAEYDAVNRLNEFLNIVLQLFKKGCEGFKKLDYFKLFDKINFKNVSNDDKIIQMILQQNSQIYVKKKDSYMHSGDDVSFFWLEEDEDSDEMIMYRIEPNDINKKNISHEELVEGYISLEKLLEESTFVNGYKTNADNERVFVLYEMDGYALYHLANDNDKNNEFRIKINSMFVTNVFRSVSPYPKCEDKEHMISLIRAQIKRRIDEYQRQNISYSGIKLKTYEDGVGEHHYSGIKLKTYEDGFVEHRRK